MATKRQEQYGNESIRALKGEDRVRKRPDTGLLAGLWVLPHVPGLLQPSDATEALIQMGLRVEDIAKSVERKHIFTHIQWNMRGYYISVKEPSGDLTWLSRDEIRSSAPLPTAFRQFLDN